MGWVLNKRVWVSLKIFVITARVRVQKMSLFNYKILPFSIDCDTMLLCCNPYYDIQFKQCFDEKQMLRILQDIPETFKIVLMAGSHEDGIEQVSKISKLQLQLQEERRKVEEQSSQSDLINDQLSLLTDNLQQKAQTKASFLHLKCLLNQTQNKISDLSKEITGIFQNQTYLRQDKRSRKQQKIQEKQLQQLKQRHQRLSQQIATRQNLLWWHQQSKLHILQNQQQQQEYEDLLSDSEERKENRVNL